MAKFSRRDFLRTASAGAGGSLLFGSAAVSAGVEEGLTPQRGKPLLAEFLHGVASGDPLADRLIIWTRLTLTERGKRFRIRRLPVGWTVATDPEFKNVVRRGFTLSRRNRDFTVKVDLVGLEPGKQYFYRFNTFTSFSPTGCGSTLPGAGIEQVRLAVMSCSNYPAGYFNVYTDAAQIPDLDAVCHLGDYIYEYGPGGYATELADAIGRGFEPGNDLELLSLRNYRDRYAQYRSDPGLQALHAAVPFICVWDDHEIANDAWKNGAENHDPATEGDWEARKSAGIRAYYEWMPIRPPEPGNKERIYRSFEFGDLLSLYMLDTRIIARDEQLNYLNYFNVDGSFNAAAFAADVGSPTRSLLGAEQLAWLQNGLFSSPAIWQVLGQQVLIGRMNIPAELLSSIADPGPEIFAALEELAVIKGRVLAGDPTVTPLERARVETVLPYNLDAWDGYQYEREVLFGTALAAGKNLVTLSGDTHNAWANNLKDLGGSAVGVEFATASVSSPGLEAVLGIPAPLAPGAETVLQTLIDDLQYTNVADRGYLTVTFGRDEAVAEWIFVDNILSPEYGIQNGRARALKVLPGPAGRVLQEV